MDWEIWIDGRQFVRCQGQHDAPLMSRTVCSRDRRELQNLIERAVLKYEPRYVELPDLWFVRMLGLDFFRRGL